jgi:hypothetical protein
VPYSTGQTSKGSGISPVILGAGIGLGVGAGLALATYGLAGAWHYRVYNYPYKTGWTFYNSTLNVTQTKPVNCLCEEFSECGCDDNTNAGYQTDILGNGSYAGLNHSVVSVADVNGTSTIILNGTLPNGTTATGGTDSPDAAFSFRHSVMQSGVYWVMAAVVGSAVFLG